MIVYDKIELENATLLEEGHSLKAAGFINKENYNLIHNELAVPKSQNNILIRAGFFLLGSFLYSSICGFITLLSLEGNYENFKVLVFIFSIIGFAGTEFLATQKFYMYGLDDAFSLGSQLTLAIAIVLSAIMSTIDSLLILASSAITRDFYQKIFRPDLKDEDLTKLSRIVTVIMALVALGIAILLYNLYPDRQIFWIMIFGWSGIAATFCPVIILSLFWKGYSEKGAIASMITGFLSVMLFKFVVSEMEGIGPYFKELDVLAPSFALAMIVGYAVSKLFPSKIAVEE